MDVLGSGGDERVLHAPERGRGRVLDQHVDERPRFRRAAEVDGRVAPRPAAKERRVGPRRALDQHLLDAADPRTVPVARDLLRQLHEPLRALDLHLVRHLLRHRRRLGPGARRVHERERAVVADLADDLERLLEVRLRLAREPDDDVGSDRQVGNGGAHPVGEREVPLACVRPPHRLQDARRARLQRQMDLLAHGFALGHGGDQGLAKVLRVRAREPDPLDAFDAVARAQQLPEFGANVRQEVAAPRVHVLAQEGHLPDAVRGQDLDLGEDLAGAPALLAPANRRDDAVGAPRVAPHRDLDPCLEGALAMHRQLGGERALVEPEAAARDADTARAEPLREVRDRAGPEGDVDERVALEDPLALRLGVAAAHGYDAIRVLPLPRGGLAQVGGELRIRLLPDRAGVEDDDVGLVRRRRLAEPELLEHALDALAVVSVHLAAERRDVVPAHAGSVASAGSAPAPDAYAASTRSTACRRCCSSLFVATSTARLSRITVTLIWPGYSRWSSISRAISCESRTAPSSSTSCGFTRTRISRPAWSAYAFSTPGWLAASCSSDSSRLT